MPDYYCTIKINYGHVISTNSINPEDRILSDFGHDLVKYGIQEYMEIECEQL